MFMLVTVSDSPTRTKCIELVVGILLERGGQYFEDNKHLFQLLI